MRVHSVFFFGGLLVFLFLAVLNTPWWGALATLPDSSEAWISSYDRMVTGFQPACATIEFRSFGGKNERVEMQTRVNAVPYSHDLLFLVQGRGVKSVCIEPSFLDFNDNVVSVMAGPHSLFFHVRKFESLKQDVVPRITLHGLEEDRVLVGVENLSLYGVQPLSIYVNGVKDHDLWPPQQGLLKERVESFEGSGVVQAEWGALTAGQQVAYEPVPRVPPLIGMVTLVLAGLACLAWFYSKPFWERVALGALSWVSGLIVLVFVLNYAWLLSPFTLNLSLLLIAGTILLHRRNVLDEAFHVPLDSFHVSMPFIFVGFLLVFCVFGVHWFASTPWTHFNVFYERASQGVIDALRIPSVDALSYLGRNATFIQGYFLFEAGISWLTGLEGVPLFAFVLAWANLLFVGAAYFLFKSAGFEGRFSWLGVVLVWLSAFVFDAAIVTPRHLIAFSLFMGSVGVFIRGSNAWKAGVLLAVASYVQVPVLAAFPFVVLALDKRLRVIETVQAAFIGLVGFLALFLPNAMAFGIPYEIRPHEWGYLITLPVASALYDHGALLLVFVGVLFAEWAYFNAHRKHAFDSKRLRMAAFLLLGLGVQLFLSYRANIFVSLVMAVFVLKGIAFLSARMQAPFLPVFYKGLALLLVLGMGTVLFFLPLLVASADVLHAATFLRGHSASNARILADPLYGHLVAFEGQRPVLADLLVEYADEKKLVDTYAFLQNKEYDVLERYGIAYTLNHKRVVNRFVYGNALLGQDLEFEGLDKVYANPSIFIHFNPSWLSYNPFIVSTGSS